MRESVARALYSTALVALTPAYLGRLWWRGAREPAYRRHWNERLGFNGSAPIEGRPVVWVHAVSLGETRAARPLVEALRNRVPAARLLLTCTTATGREAGAELLQPGDLQVWLPYDTPGAVRRFLRRFRPAVGVLMETEVWPNLLHAAEAEGVPMVLANARLSERSARKGHRFASLLRPAVSRLAAVLAQTAVDAERLRAAGARHVEVAGNLKFDMTPPPKLLARGHEWREALPRSVVLAASTREGEEAPLLAAWRQHRGNKPLLVIVPRHPQRFDEVAGLVEQAGFSLARRSGWETSPPSQAATADVWLGDSMREMPLYYGMSDVALLGGSFAPLGGQNLIEAAACGCPIVMGPHTFNFAEAARLALTSRAAVRVAGLPEGVERAIAMADDIDRNAWVQRALAFAQAHRGATERMAERIAALALR